MSGIAWTHDCHNLHACDGGHGTCASGARLGFAWIGGRASTWRGVMSRHALDTPELAARLQSVSVLSTFAPASDGIARYADQLVPALAKHGAVVTRIGLAGRDSGGDAIVDLARGGRFLRVLSHSPRSNTVLVMWHSHYLAPGRQAARVAAIASMALGFRLRRTVVLQHEPDDDLVSGVTGRRRIPRVGEEWLRGVMWRGATEIWFHSEYERAAFCQRYPRAARKCRMSLVTHGEDFAPEVRLSQTDARQRLGVPAGELMFLCLGFLSAHKGIDRVIRAFTAAAPPDSRLWIVGGAMREDEGTRRHIAALHEMAAAAPNVEMSERCVDNVEFDTWLRATDYAVLAYRSAASSSVIPRAQLLGARVIGSGVGGTAEQLRPGLDVIAEDEEALTQAFRDASDSPR